MSTQIPNIKKETNFNFFTSIWIVPFIALMIAGWLAFEYFSTLGPEIRIVFEKNEGLKAGQSYIKYKDVPIGLVTKIELQEDGEGVVVIARMDTSVKSYLNKESKFWIVKPEVGISGISGLDTLISGTYINMYVQKSEQANRKWQWKKNTTLDFIGLNYAYRNISGGEYFILNSPLGMSSIKEGTPIFFKNIKVGQVEYIVLSLYDASVDVIVFIDKLYTPYIHSTSKFWVRSTLDMSVKKNYLNVKVAPLTDLIQGAIEFSSTGKDETKKVPNGFIFHLYENKSALLENTIGEKGVYMKTFMLELQEAFANLKRDTPVEFKGFKVGRVTDIHSYYSKKKQKIQSRVLLKIDTSVFKDPTDSNHSGEENFYEAVKKGLRAKIIETNPLLNSLAVALSFEANTTQSNIIVKGAYPLLPTIKDNSDSITKSIYKILDKINNLKLEKLISSIDNLMEESIKPIAHMDEVLKELKTTVINMNGLTSQKSFKNMPKEINKTLKELTITLKTTKNIIKGYKSNSLITRQVSGALRSVTDSMEEMRTFLRMLNRKPDSLVFGDK